MTALPHITLGQHSRAGRHGVNQDFHGALLPDGVLRRTKGIAVALADGIGSSPVSQVASAAAVRGFLDDYYATSEAWSVRRSAQRVIAALNAWLHGQTLRSAARFDKDRGHVCTFSALVLKGREVHVLHVGDARVCRVHPHALEVLTDDHRVHVSAGESYLARALGADAHVEIDYRCLPAEVGDIYLLATDGAHERLDAAAVHDALARCGDDLDAAASRLVDRAEAAGGDDDKTVQLVRIDALPAFDADPLPPAPEGLARPPPLAPGLRFEGFTVVRELHANGRSRVHLAVDDASGELAVLKTPATDGVGDIEPLDRLLREEWVARRLNSPHVLQAWPTERTRSHAFVALRFIDGPTLRQWMVDHPKPDLHAVRRLVAQVGRGLQAFHGREMLHQDLRPANVMVDAAGTAIVIDFGAVHVAGLVEGTARARPDTLEGELQYAAPEYFTGDGGSPRSDLFSLAVITYEMLTGALPYGLAATRVRTVADARRLRYVPVRHHRPELPDWLDGVLQKALHPDPAKRQEAVSEYLHDLASPGPAFHRRRGVPLVERRPVRFWQATTVALAVAVLALLALRVLGA